MRCAFQEPKVLQKHSLQLSTDEFAVLSRLVDEALEIPEARRARWLENLSEPLPGIKSRLQKLFAKENSVRMEGFLDLNLKAGFHAGGLVGIYCLVREIGLGGMSSVWLAQRTDELTERLVALKLPFTHLQSSRFADRFARERDILARLTHPNIARLYDAGISAEGQPYLAMEFVAGDPLTQYCSDHQLGIAARLRLFIQVLAAVHYAHTHNVIHRDLKPSNILVRDDAQVVLLDFGIAKLLIDGESRDTEFTRHGGLALTPDFASPEQIRGEALGPASDIYSLGVVLYELLSGRRPYALRNSTRRALEEAILSVDPCRPSDVVIDPDPVGEWVTRSHKAQVRCLQGDLDAIVLKAMKKEPRQRYTDAGSFAVDLNRYLNSEPVAAHADSLWYRTKKYARRHRSWLQGAAVTAAAVSSLIAGANLLWRSPSPPFAPPAHSIAVLPFVNLSGDTNQEYLADGISEELLNALSNIGELQVAARTSSFSFKGKNTEIAKIARKLNVGTIIEGSVRRNGDTVRITAQLVNALSGYSLWSQTYDHSLADILKFQGEVATVVADRLQVRLIGDEIDKIKSGGTLNGEAYDAYLRGMQLYYRPNTGEAGYRGALAAFTKALNFDPRFAEAYSRQAATLLRIYMIGGDPSARAALQHQARAAAEHAVELAPQRGESHLVLAASHDIGVEDRSEAAREYDRALHLSPGSAWVQLNYGLFASLSGHFEPAITAARRAVRLDPRNIDARDALGVILTGARRYSEAMVIFQEAKLLRPDSHFIEYYIADNLLASSQFEAARRECESVSAPLDAEGRHDCLALAYHALGRQADAERELALFKAQDGDGAAYRYARIYAQWGENAMALQWLKQAERLEDADLSLLKTDWHFDPIRDEPTFKAIEARMNYPQ